MKKLLLMMMAAMVSFAFISCEKNQESKDDEIGQHDPASDADQIEITGYNGLEWFQNSIVVIDENGKPVRRVYGEMLDPSDTTILSVCVSDLKMAEEIFLSWVAPEKDVNKVNGGYDYNLTDYDGSPQGSVAFRNADGKQGILATVSVGANRLQRQQHPIQSDDPDDPYTCMFPLPRDLTFFCIQGNTGGKEAILVHLSPDENARDAHGRPFEYISYNAHKQCASLPEAEKVLKYYTEYYQFWEAMIDIMENKGEKWDWHFGLDTTGNEEFILNSYNKEAGTIKILALDDKKGKISDVDLYSTYHYRYMYVRIFPPYVKE